MERSRLWAVSALFTVAGLCLLSAAPAGASAAGDEPRTAVLIRTTEWTVDRQVRTSDEIIAVGPDGVLERRPGLTAKAAPSALIRNTIHWALGSKINYLITQFLKDEGHRGKFGGVVKKFGNKRRGNKTTPTQTISKNTTTITPIDQFFDPVDFYQQTFLNGSNEVIMTADDQFFRDPFGTLFDPDVVIRSIIMTFGEFSQQGGKFVGTLGIVEADVLARSDLFDVVSSKFAWQVLLTAIFHQTLGYPSSIWTNDILGIFRPYVTPQTFKNKNSDVWAHMMWRDMDYYPPNLIDFAASGAAAGAVPFIRPARHTLMDIGGNVLPDPDLFNVTLLIPIFNYTNLVAPNKKMKIKFSWVETTATGEVLHPIATFAGKMEQYPINFQGNKLFPTVFHNTVTVKNNNKGQLRFDDLRETVEDHGMPMTVDDIAWNKVLPVEIAITGLDTQDGFATVGAKAKKTVKERYYVINSDNEDVPPN